LCLIFSFNIYGQDFTITGKLQDETEDFPLESATVFAEKISDSTLVTYTISDRNGAFVLKGNTGVSELNVNISYTGYSAIRKRINLSNSRDVNMGDIKMLQAAEQLEGVVVTASRAPITIKKDTLEFNVASFKTKKDASVEDLLKELPGVEVSAEGAITVNGKPVNKILVNGKSFFGDDPTIATRNLTKEMVDKIQVTDTKTDSEAFTGEAGDDTNKTINITIDEEKNKGIFGRVAAGAGTDKRFEYAGLINYFDNDMRISVLGAGNNINSPGFSFGEIQKMFGGARYMSYNSNGSFNFGGRSFGGGEGITNSRTAGANYADNFGEKTELTTDYFYSAANSYNDEIRQRENILPENRYFSNTTSNTSSNSDNHSVNLRLKTETDSTFQINFRPQFDYSVGDSRFSRNEETRNVAGDLTNQSNTESTSKRERTNFESSLSFTKKYGAKGGFLRLDLDNENNKNRRDDFQNSRTEIYGDTLQVISRDQFTNGEQATDGYSVSAEWRIPLLDKKLFLGIEYEYEDETRKDKQSVFDFNESTMDYTIFNVDQSTDFTNNNRNSKPEIGLNYNDEKLRIRLRTGYVFRTLESDDALREFSFSNNFNALELSTSFSYRFNKKTSLYTGYYLNNNAPSVSQLSPYIDVSDPLNIRQGNPDLGPSNQHSFYSGFNNYDFQTKSGFYSHLNGSVTNDQVVAKTTVDENFVRTTTFTNVDGTYNYRGNIGYNKNKKLDSIRSIRYNVGFSVSGNRSVNFNNDIQYASLTTTYSPNIGFGFTWEDLFEIRPSYSLSYSNNKYNIDLFENRDYLRHEVSLRTTTTFPKKLEWNNDIEYSYNPDVAVGFQKSALFWNSSLAYSILKDKGLVTLKVYDLLNQNTNSQRISTDNYIEDSQSTVLQQYFMLTFSYKFNTLGKKGEVNENNWWGH